jgi:hypothetical protein
MLFIDSNRLPLVNAEKQCKLAIMLLPTSSETACPRSSALKDDATLAKLLGFLLPEKLIGNSKLMGKKYHFQGNMLILKFLTTQRAGFQ